MKNLIWGGTWGLFFGVVYCAIGLLLRLGRGPDFLRGYGITFGQLMLLYAAAPVAGGLVVGLARPLTRWRAGAIVVGMMAAFLVVGGIMLTLEGPVNHWQSDECVVTCASTSKFGSARILVIGVCCAPCDRRFVFRPRAGHACGAARTPRGRTSCA